MNETIQKIEKNIFLQKSIREIIEHLNSGELSPVEIAEDCLKRIEEFNERYMIWVCYDREKLFEQARASAMRLENGYSARRLESIPIGIKDIFNTIDFATQMGSPLWKNFTAGNDARVIYYLKQSGAIIPGKTDTAEFAVHAIGNCLNPHDITRTPGTSSSGSAAAVALGMVPAAIGTQTAGSIVRPSSFCGVYGCKPSFGLIPRTGMLKTTDSLDTIGFFTSRYEDLERLFDIIRVHGTNYPISNTALTDVKRQSKETGKPWRVAFTRTHTWDEASEYAREAILDFTGNLALADEIEVTEATLPDEIKSSHIIHSKIYDKTLSYYFQEEFKMSEQVSPIMNEIIQRGKEISVQEYHEALKQQESLTRMMDKFFDNYDIVISLSTAGEAPLREETEKPDPSLIWTLTHLPVISVPAFTSPKGLPFGVQFTARKYNDLLLFRFADHLRNLRLIPEGVNPLASL